MGRAPSASPFARTAHTRTENTETLSSVASRMGPAVACNTPLSIATPDVADARRIRRPAISFGARLTDNYETQCVAIAAALSESAQLPRRISINGPITFIIIETNGCKGEVSGGLRNLHGNYTHARSPRVRALARENELT